MKIYIFFKNDSDRDDNYQPILTVMNNPSIEEFKKRFPDENDFYVEEHELEEVEKTNTHDLSYFNVIFEPDIRSNFAKYPKPSKYDSKNLKIKEIEIVEKDYTYQSPQIFEQYIGYIHHRGVNLFTINKEQATYDAIKIMKKFLEENGDE
jgi:hypothetical protein